MLGYDFYFGLYQKYIVYFGTVFNDIHITRTDSAGEITQLMKVPVSYSPKDKMLQRVNQDPEIGKKAAIQLPRMGYEITNVSYDGSRKLNSTTRIARKNTDANTLKHVYTPVPYNIDFRLSIMVKNQEDGHKIIEQILPYFTPDWTATLHLIPEMNIDHDIPIILNSVSLDDQYEGDYDQKRVIVWTLDFTMKAFFYGPVRSGAIIKFANVNFYTPTIENLRDAVGNSLPVDRVTVQPGLTANGEPTSNIDLTINKSLIEEDDDYGYIVTISGYLET